MTLLETQMTRNVKALVRRTASWGGAMLASLTLFAACDRQAPAPDDRSASTHLLTAAQPEPSALLVVSSKTPDVSQLIPSDRGLRQALLDLGFAVEVVAARDVKASHSAGKRVVVISESTQSADVGDRLRDVAVPLVSLEPALFDDLRMTGLAWLGDYGDAQQQTDLVLRAPGHPLAAALNGLVTVTRAPTKFVWGRAAASAIKVASMAGDESALGIFAYEQGAPMHGGFRAPARRVGWFAGEHTPASLTPDGWALFEAAIRWAAAPRALLVVRQGVPLSPSDEALRKRLEGMGFHVVLRGDVEVSAQDAVGVDVVVLSESVESERVGTRLTHTTTPLVSLEPSLFDDLRMVGPGWAQDYGDAQGQNRITIILPTHPLAAGLSAASHVVTTTPGKFVWGRPRRDGIMPPEVLNVAGIHGRPELSAIFAYERGARMEGLQAPGRRVGWFAGRDVPATFNDNGFRLFDAAVRWASGLYETVTPRAECVVRMAANQYLGVFGYHSSAATTVVLPGTANRFTSGSPQRGQPTEFRPGRHRAQFTVAFDGKPLTWELQGRRATVSRDLPPCEAACVDPIVLSGLYPEVNPARAATFGPVAPSPWPPAAAQTPGLQVPPLTPDESRALRDAFSWARTLPVAEDDEDGDPALYHAAIYVENRRHIDLLHAFQIHFDPLPFFDEEQRRTDEDVGLVEFPMDGEGAFVYAVIPGAVFNEIRAGALDPADPVELFRVIHLRPVPTPEAKGCRAAGLASFVTSGNASCPVAPAFEQQACAALINYEFLGRYGFKYRNLEPGEPDLAAQAIYDLFPPGDGIDDDDPDVVRQPLLGRRLRRLVKKVVRKAQAASARARRRLTQVASAFVGSAEYSLQVLPQTLAPEFAPGTMVRTWGPAAPGDLRDPVPGSGANAPVSLPGLEVRIVNGPFLSIGRTNDFNTARARALDIDRPSRVCIRMDARHAQLEDYFWVPTRCGYARLRPRGGGYPVPGQTVKLEARDSYLNIMAQFSEGAIYMNNVARTPMRKVRVLVGDVARLLSRPSEDTGRRRPYAPCLGVPNWREPITTLGAALGAFYGKKGGTWVRRQIQGHAKTASAKVQEAFDRLPQAFEATGIVSRELVRLGHGAVAAELQRLAGRADELVRLSRTHARHAAQLAEDLADLTERAAELQRRADPALANVERLARQTAAELEQAFAQAQATAREASRAASLLSAYLDNQVRSIVGTLVDAAASLARQMGNVLGAAVNGLGTAVGVAADIVTQIGATVVGAVAGELTEVLLDADIVMPDDANRSRGVASHEYGHFVLCNLMYNADPIKYGTAYTQAMVDTVLGQLDKRDRARDPHVVLNEGFADFIAGQLVGGVNYFTPDNSKPSGGMDHCKASSNACLDANSFARPASAEDFNFAVGRAMTTLHDAFDGHPPGTLNPGDGSIWEEASAGLRFTSNQPANLGDEQVALAGSRLQTMVRRMFDRGTLLTEGNLFGGLNRVMSDDGYNWCQRCELFRLHEGDRSCAFAGPQPSGLRCAFEGCPAPQVEHDGICTCPDGQSDQGGTCVITSCPTGQFLHQGACVTTCPCPCPMANECYCFQVGLPESACFKGNRTTGQCEAQRCFE